MKILLVAIEDDRWGPPRLPKALSSAGFEVAALCPCSNPTAKSRYLAQHFSWPRSRAWVRLAASLKRAMSAWQPALVVPCDEQVVALVQFLLCNPKMTGLERWPKRLFDALARSMGPPASFDAMLRKNSTQLLARRIGVATPAGLAVANFPQARDEARRIGYPVVLKRSFSWGGAGVRVCRSEGELQSAVAEMTPKPGIGLKRQVRWLLSRDWYPNDNALWLQAGIAGYPAMYTALALDGRMLAGFAGMPVSTNGTAGPSTVVELGHNDAMEAASRRMVEAMGATGFVSFDFMIEQATGKAYLLECNPRPNQVSHLGPRVGVDLCRTLRETLQHPAGAGRPSSRCANRKGTVALFPAEWQRAPASVAINDHFHDVPWDEPELVVALAGTCQWADPLPPMRDRSRAAGILSSSLRIPYTSSW